MSNSFPHHLQRNQMDCGPSCLYMIGKHYGRSFSIEKLRELTEIGKEGVNILGISDAAEKIGFRTQAVQLSVNDLRSKIKLPCILHWGQNHFVVLYKVKRNAFYIADPGKSLLKYSEKEFVQGWVSAPAVSHEVAPPILPKGEGSLEDRFEDLHNNSFYSNQSVAQSNTLSSTFPPPAGEIERALSAGEIEGASWGAGIALSLEPTPSFYNNQYNDDYTEQKSKGFGSIILYLFPYKKLIVQLMLGLLLGSLLQLILPFLTQSVIDTGVNTGNLPFVYVVLFAQLALFAGRLSVDFIRSWILYHISSRINISILTDFLIKLMKLPVSYFDSKKTGDIMQRMNDHSRIQNFLTGTSLSTLFSLFNLVVFSVVLAMYNTGIFAVFAVASVLYILWIFIFLKKRKILDYKQFDIAAAEQSKTMEIVQGMQEIKLHGCEKPKRWQWERLQARTFRLGMKGLALNQWQQTGAFFINEGKNIFITFLAAKAVINHEGGLTLGGMLAIQYIIGQLNGPIEQMINFVQSWQLAKISLDRLNEIHSLRDEEAPTSPNPSEGRAYSEDRQLDYVGELSKVLPTNKSIQLNNVSFTYPGAGNESVLKNIHITFPEGKTTAIVGTSGSGKTTLIKLLLKFYDSYKGEIKVGKAPPILPKVAPPILPTVAPPILPTGEGNLEDRLEDIQNISLYSGQSIAQSNTLSRTFPPPVGEIEGAFSSGEIEGAFSSGEIEGAGANLQNLSHRTWRKAIGVVMQESFIFNDSIAANIAVDGASIDTTRLKQAAITANILEFIESLPLGFNTKIGAEGIGISAGQKQRILIARAVYKNPDYIFFDEATNSLDANNETVIMKNLAAFFHNRTVIVVAHRLSTVKNADQIVVLNKGKITEAGTHAALIKLKGEYFTLVKNQLELGD